MRSKLIQFLEQDLLKTNTMANTNEYIVFEADQVLTNDHLNETFSYLDQQNRWTRNKLIGIGIVCGFNFC